MNRSRHRTIRALFGVGIALAVPLFTDAADASPIDEQRDRVGYYTDQLESLEEQSAILAEDLDVAIGELEDLEADVADAETAVTAQEADVATTQQQLSDTVVRDYMGADSTSIGALFADADTVADQIRREEFGRAALHSGTATSDDLNRELTDLNEKQVELTEAREAAEDQRNQVESAKSAAEEKAGEYRDLKSDAEAELGEMIREEEERRARESYERMLAEQRAVAAAAAQQAATEQAATEQAATETGGGATGAGNTSGGNAAPQAAPQAAAPQAQGPAAPAPPAASAPIPQASSRAGTAVNAAMSQQGVSYRYAASEPGVAFDCSGLTGWAWAQAGVQLTHQSRAQYAQTAQVPASSAQPGDLLFFYSPISHVAMYIGGGQLVHAPNSGSVVHVRAVNWGNVVGVGRPG